MYPIPNSQKNHNFGPCHRKIAYKSRENFVSSEEKQQHTKKYKTNWRQRRNIQSKKKNAHPKKKNNYRISKWIRIASIRIFVVIKFYVGGFFSFLFKKKFMPSKFAAHSYSIFDCFPRNGSTNENKETAAEFLLKRQCFIVNRFLMEWLTNFHSILNIVYVFSLKESIQLIETPVQSCSEIFFYPWEQLFRNWQKKTESNGIELFAISSFLVEKRITVTMLSSFK